MHTHLNSHFNSFALPFWIRKANRDLFTRAIQPDDGDEMLIWVISLGTNHDPGLCHGFPFAGPTQIAGGRGISIPIGFHMCRQNS